MADTGVKVLDEACAGHVNTALYALESMISMYEGMLSNLASASTTLGGYSIPTNITKSISDMIGDIGNMAAMSTAVLAAAEDRKNVMLAAAAGAIGTLVSSIIGSIPVDKVDEITSIINSMQSNMADQITDKLLGLVPTSVITDIVNQVNGFLGQTITIPLVPPAINAATQAISDQMSVVNRTLSDLRSKLAAATACML